MSRTTKFVIAGLAVAFVIAGFGSFYASSNPDGLEYVAQDTGFIDSAKDHSTGDGPLADYGVKGVDNQRLSGGLAGVIGASVTLLIMGGLVFVVRRRSHSSQAA